MPVQAPQHRPDDRPVLGSSTHYFDPGGVQPAEEDSRRGAPAGVDAIAGAPVQPLRTSGADGDLRVVPEPDQILLGESKLALRATSSIPVLAGPAVQLHGRGRIDGSIAEPLPVARALTQGVTHVLALVNRMLAQLRRPTPRAAGGPLGALAGPTRTWARGDGAGTPPPPTKEGDPRQRRPSGTREGYLLAITPPHDAGIRGLTADPVRVRAAADSGFAAMLTALKGRRALSVMRNAGDRSR